MDASYDLAAALSRVETRQIANDYTFRFQGQLCQIATEQVRPGMPGAAVRVEARLDGSIAVRFQQSYLRVAECREQPKAPPLKSASVGRGKAPTSSSAWRQSHSGIARGGMPIWKAAEINRTRTLDELE